MILILSQETFDPTTDEVINWISYLGRDYFRLNGSDPLKKCQFSARFTSSGNTHLKIKTSDKSISSHQIKAVWFWRWLQDRDIAKNLDSKKDSDPLSPLFPYITSELWGAGSSLAPILKKAYWLGSFRESLNKLSVLKEASLAGLHIPETIITNSKKELKTFKSQQKSIIIKSIAQAHSIQRKSAIFMTYTTELTDEKIDALSDHIFPCLAQKNIQKQYEIRTFYLEGKCYSMAIFSQLQTGSQTDFRVYGGIPPRTSCYKLPHAMEKKIKKLMQKMGLQIGSLDFLKDTNGKYYFLEINPVGQFGMTSDSCNYSLDKKIAQLLITHDK